MKAVILAGGYGTRISEETTIKPKPMVEIGGRPILWHIMKIYAAHGITDFVVCSGYKGHVIKRYFAEYFMRRADCRFDLKHNIVEVIHNDVEPWIVTVIDTGEETMTGGRLKRVRDHLDGTFCLTYGDGVSDIPISEVIRFHREQQAVVTLTAVQPPGRFGVLTLGTTQTWVDSFSEKPSGDGAWINGGFFVVEPEALDYIGDDSTIWEKEPLQMLARDRALAAYRHRGFWQPLDTLRDKMTLEQLWSSGQAPWRVWDRAGTREQDEPTDAIRMVHR